MNTTRNCNGTIKKLIACAAGHNRHPANVVGTSFSETSEEIRSGVPRRVWVQAKNVMVPIGELINWSAATLETTATGWVGLFGMMNCTTHVQREYTMNVIHRLHASGGLSCNIPQIDSTRQVHTFSNQWKNTCICGAAIKAPNRAIRTVRIGSMRSNTAGCRMIIPSEAMGTLGERLMD